MTPTLVQVQSCPFAVALARVQVAILRAETSCNQSRASRFSPSILKGAGREQAYASGQPNPPRLEETPQTGAVVKKVCQALG